MTLVTSRQNPRVREIRALRARRTREEQGLCYVEGIRPVAEAIDAGAEIDLLVVAPRQLTSAFAQRLVADAAEREVPVLEVTREVFAGISERDGPQGLAAVVRQRWASLDDLLPVPGECWIALDGVADPGNLGTVIRTADATGAAGVILVGHATDPYDPGAIRASTGTVFTTTLARADFDTAVAWAQLGGARIVGSSARAADDYRVADYGDPTLLVLGSERDGLSAEQRAACDTLVRIPMRGAASSLNLAVAAGLLLYRVLDHREAGAAPARA